MIAPTLAAITVIVPVRNNPTGIARLLSWWLELAPVARPRELLVVDDGSRVPVHVVGEAVRVIRIKPAGPAAARNAGWISAATEWCAFLDSDCVPDAGWPAQFAEAWDGEIAVQGRVRALGTDRVSRFYESQRTLEPMLWTTHGRPQYLITANALVHRAALHHVGGFDPRFPLAGGEDVDIGYRLAQFGALRFCPSAGVAH
ncbi:MAG TPA: glycosyltransferase, partial [Myxococcales bacterium]|nr:glycosyltransferase [Myxococcales bacterium]